MKSRTCLYRSFAASDSTDRVEVGVRRLLIGRMNLEQRPLLRLALIMDHLEPRRLDVVGENRLHVWF